MAIGRLREAMAGELDPGQRFRATMLLAGLLGQTGQVADAAELLEEHVDALADRPDLRAPAEAGLVNITRIDPATRPRAARVVERLRRRVDAGEEHDQAVLGTISAEMGMAGEPAGPMAELAERALDGFDLTIGSAAGWSGYNAVRSLVVAERYDTALRVLDRALEVARQRGAVLDVGAALVFRAELYLQTGDITAAEVDARSIREIAGVCGWPMGDGFAAAWLGEVLIERGELDEAAAVLPGAPADALPSHLPADLGAARARPAAAGAGPLRGGGRGPARVGAPRARHRAPDARPHAVALAAGRGAARARRAGRGAAPGRRGARAGASRRRRAPDRHRPPDAWPTWRATTPACCARRPPRWTPPRRSSSAPARTPTWAPRCAARARPTRRASSCGSPSTSPTAAARTRSRTRRSASCAPPARGPAGGRRRAPRRSRRASAGSPSWRPRALRTARSRRRCSSPPPTVEFHLRNAYRKLGISGRPGLSEALA